jgi:hypothetical protein
LFILIIHLHNIKKTRVLEVVHSAEENIKKRSPQIPKKTLRVKMKKADEDNNRTVQ